MPLVNKSYVRKYYARHVEVACPACKAVKRSKCRRPDGVVLSGTSHIERVEARNKVK